MQHHNCQKAKTNVLILSTISMDARHSQFVVLCRPLSTALIELHVNAGRTYSRWVIERAAVESGRASQ